MPRGGPRLRSANGAKNQVGERIQEWRKTTSLTQEVLCERIDTATTGEWEPDRKEISRIENGVRIVTDLEVLILAQALECDASWLLLGSLVETNQSNISPQLVHSAEEGLG
ncbi:MAG: helix-turn-helix domain-containing protein [Janthinobacterium lividum]